MSGLVDIWTSQLEKLREKGQQSFFSEEPISGQVLPVKVVSEMEEIAGHGLQF